MASRSRSALSSVALALHRIGRLAGGENTARILYYHSVSDDPVRSSVSPAVFAAQIEHLRQRYRVLPLADVVSRLAAHVPLPADVVAITLDDGFRDNYEHAFPVLARLGVPATIFLTAAYIGTDRLPTLTRTDFIPRPLDWGQVKEMHVHGIAFGSHTLTHPMLSQVPLDEARREIALSRKAIEDRLGSEVSLFCYPRGDFNTAVKRVVGEEGYAAACTTVPGVNGSRADLFALRRTYVSRRDTVSEFVKKVAGAYDLLQQAGVVLSRLRPAARRRVRST